MTELETLVPGAMYSVPLVSGLRGLLRILALLPCDAEHPDAYYFVIACEADGAESPTDFDRVARRFLGLTHEAWGGRLLGHWTVGPPPEAFRFEGVVATTPAEHAMAISTYRSGTWDRFPHMLLREWRWRHDRSEYEAARLREKEEAQLARARRHADRAGCPPGA